MEEVTDPQVVSARRALLDALEALGTQRDAVILVGAQAIYLHTGGAGVALAEFTTDADLAVDPTKLRADPLVQDSMNDRSLRTVSGRCAEPSGCRPRSLSPSSTRSRSGSTHQLDRTRRTPRTSTACSSQSTQPHLSRHFVRSCATQSRG